jgi:hypothetical protein
MLTDTEFIDGVHLLIHSVRLINGYKPSEMEKKVSKLVLDKFEDCKECKEIKERIKNTPEQKGFFKKLTEAMDK